MADGSRHSMAYIKESTYGVTPASPTLKPIRGGKTTLGLSKDSIQSEELRDDRQIADMRHGNQQVGGSIPVELSYGSFDDFLEAILCSTWQTDTPVAGTDQLKAGVERSSFTIERYFADIGSVNKPYHRYRGVEFNSMEIKVAPNAIVTAGFDVLGKGYSTDTTALSGSSYDPETTTSPFDSFSGTINENGSAIAVITEINLKLENGLKPRFVVGSNETILPQIANSNVTGQLTAYFEDSTLIDKYINETESDIDFTLVDPAGNEYKFILPRIKYSDGKPDVNGPDSILLTMPFQALFDETEQTNIIIERNPA